MSNTLLDQSCCAPSAAALLPLRPKGVDCIGQGWKDTCLNLSPQLRFPPGTGLEEVPGFCPSQLVYVFWVYRLTIKSCSHWGGFFAVSVLGWELGGFVQIFLEPADRRKRDSCLERLCDTSGSCVSRIVCVSSLWEDLETANMIFKEIHAILSRDSWSLRAEENPKDSAPCPHLSCRNY